MAFPAFLGSDISWSWDTTFLWKVGVLQQPKWLEPLGQGSCTGPASSLPGCTVSPLQCPTASLAAVGKSLFLPIGATLWGGKWNYCACELCCESESKRNGKCCSGTRERWNLTNICLCKSNHLSSEMFIFPFLWLYFLNCHMYFLWYFSLVKLRREGLIINLGYIPNKIVFVIFTV